MRSICKLYSHVKIKQHRITLECSTLDSKGIRIYITWDRATRDEGCYYWFVGRADDVINTGGHILGPFEVESVLIEHPAVAEAGIIGLPKTKSGKIMRRPLRARGWDFPRGCVHLEG